MVLVLVHLKSATLHIVNTTMGRIKFREAKKCDRESRVQQAIEERKEKDTSLCDSAILYEIPRSTLSDRIRGIPTCHEAKENCQVISPAVK